MKNKPRKRVTNRRARARLTKHVEQVNRYAAGIDVEPLFIGTTPFNFWIRQENRLS